MKRVIVTGGSDGLGACFANVCLEHGIEVVCLSRSKPATDIIHIPCDLTEDRTIAEAVQTLGHCYDTFDALINCAGMFQETELMDLNYTDLDILFRTNIIGIMSLIGKMDGLIKKNNADILNVASTVGHKAYKKQAGYGATKRAMRGFTKNLQLEYAGTPTRVISFDCGGFKSNFVQKFSGKQADLKGYMNPQNLAYLIYTILMLPKSIEVSEIVMNRK